MIKNVRQLCKVFAFLSAISCIEPCYCDIVVQNNEPISKFYLPVFSKNGFKSCELTGKDAEFVSSDNININDLLIRCFNDDGSNVVQMTIESPRANAEPSKNIVSSGGVMFLAGNKFTGVCNDWVFYAAEKKVVGRSAVRVLFEENVGAFLQQNQ
ncbi:MAG: hypothetical protein EOM76_12315 [Sphingobacteriia bacterium]|nr:hypothetical protein [Sphingobacteriia bacterium]